MSPAASNPYDPPAAESEFGVDQQSGWSLRSLSFIAILTGFGGVVSSQFITSSPRVSPSGVQTVTASLEVAVISAVLSFVAASNLLSIRRRLGQSGFSGQSIGLLSIAAVSAFQGILVVWRYVFPFAMHLLGLA